MIMIIPIMTEGKENMCYNILFTGSNTICATQPTQHRVTAKAESTVTHEMSDIQDGSRHKSSEA